MSSPNARELAQRTFETQPWANAVAQRVLEADDGDRGTLIVGHSLLHKASIDDEAEVARRSAAAEEERRAQIAQRVQARTAARSGINKSLLLALLALIVTVLVPWQFGRWALRDVLFRTQSPEVFDTSFRGIGDYFLSDYLAGTAIVVLLAGAGLVLFNVRHSRSWVVVGVVIVSAGIALMPFSASTWVEAEAKTTAKLAESPPEGVAECSTRWKVLDSEKAEGHALFEGPGNLVHVWRPILIATGFEQDSEQCTKIEIYDGVKHVATSEAVYDLKSGSLAVLAGDTPASSFVAFAVSAIPGVEGSTGQIGAIRLSDGKLMWTKSVGELAYSSHPDLIVIANSLVVEHVTQPDSARRTKSKIVGYDIKTGARSWNPRCPEGEPAWDLNDARFSDLTSPWVRCGRQLDGEGEPYNVNREDGSLFRAEE